MFFADFLQYYALPLLTSFYIAVSEMELPREMAEIEKDCLQLKRRKDLSMFGYGELYVIELVRELLKEGVLTKEQVKEGRRRKLR